jgi:hypothetical protein
MQASASINLEVAVMPLDLALTDEEKSALFNLLAGGDRGRFRSAVAACADVARHPGEVTSAGTGAALAAARLTPPR